MEPITIETTIKAPIEKIWQFFNDPEYIMEWNHASPEWHVPRAENDVRVGGKMHVRMEAKDGSFGFDIEATYSEVEQFKTLAYSFSDGRKIRVEFSETANGIHIRETFDPEHENPREFQQKGWQAILDNFKKYVLTH